MRIRRALNELLAASSLEAVAEIQERHADLLGDRADAMLDSLADRLRRRGRVADAARVAGYVPVLQSGRRFGSQRAARMHGLLARLLAADDALEVRNLLVEEPELLSDEALDAFDRVTAVIRAYSDRAAAAALDDLRSVLERCRRVGVAAAYGLQNSAPPQFILTFPVPAAIEHAVLEMGTDPGPERVIELLTVATGEPVDDPTLRAAMLAGLGDAHLAAQRADVDAARSAYAAALDALVKEAAPSLWASVQEKLGLLALNRGLDPVADGHAAAEHFEHVATVFTPTIWPRQCAATHLNLASSWLLAAQHPDPREAAVDGVADVTRGIAACRVALPLLDRDRDAAIWVEGNRLLATCLIRRRLLVSIARSYDGLMRSPLADATIADLPGLQTRLGLSAISPESTEPSEPAPSGFPRHDDIDLEADGQATADALRDVLRLVTAEELPELWAWAQLELGRALTEVPDQAGRETAMECFRAAGTVYTIDTHADEYVKVATAQLRLQHPDGSDVELAERLCDLGDRMIDRGHFALAGQVYGDAVSTRMLAAMHDDDRRTGESTRARAELGQVAAREAAGQFAEAKAAAEAALARLRRIGADPADLARMLVRLGEVELALGRPVVAERRLIEAGEQAGASDLSDVAQEAAAALVRAREAIVDPMLRLQGTEARPRLADRDRYLDREQARTVTAIMMAALDAPDEESRREALGQGLWRFGAEFVVALSRAVEEVGGWTEDLFNETLEISFHWIAGDPLTERIDDSERRVRFIRGMIAWLGFDEMPIALLRAAVGALLNLPAGHPERDLPTAYESLAAIIERARAAGDVGTRLHATDMMIRLWFEYPTDITPLVDEALEDLDRYSAEDPDYDAELRTALLSNAVLYRGGLMLKAREEGRDDGPATEALEESLARIQREPAPPATADLAANPSTVEAIAYEWLDREREAAVAWNRAVERGDPGNSTTQNAAVRSATLWTRLGDHGAVRAVLEPTLPFLQERYLAATVDADVEAAGRRLADAIDLLVPAQLQREAWNAAVVTLDTGKSLRLRHRHAVRRAAPTGELLSIERALHSATRGVPTASRHAYVEWGTDVLGADEPPMTRLLEAYRAARTRSTTDVTDSPSISAIAAVLDDREAAVVLGVHAAGTVVAVIVRGDRDVPAAYRTLESPTERNWIELMIGETTDDWLGRLSTTEGGPQRLAALLRTANTWLGRPLAALLADLDVSRAVVVPHKLLHLLPWSGLPALAGVELSVSPSAADLVRVRRSAAPGAASEALVICDPTGDLPVSTVEGISAGRALRRVGMRVETVERSGATEDAIAASLPTVGLVHFAGHAQSDLVTPLRSALLLHPGDVDEDPFPGWLSRVTRWLADGPDADHADLPGVGRLHRRELPGDVVELSMELGETTTLWARYHAEVLLEPGIAERWSAGDLAVSDSLGACQVAVLSACESGTVGVDAFVDESSGLPAALGLAGARTVVATLWPVSEPFAAVFVDRLYDAIGTRQGVVDLRTVVHEVQSEVRAMNPAAARGLLLDLADVAPDPRAAFTLEAYAAQIDDATAMPFSDPYDWAAFVVTGSGRLVLPEGDR